MNLQLIKNRCGSSNTYYSRSICMINRILIIIYASHTHTASHAFVFTVTTVVFRYLMLKLWYSSSPLSMISLWPRSPQNIIVRSFELFQWRNLIHVYFEFRQKLLSLYLVCVLYFPPLFFPCKRFHKFNSVVNQQLNNNDDTFQRVPLVNYRVYDHKGTNPRTPFTV